MTLRDVATEAAPLGLLYRYFPNSEPSSARSKKSCRRLLAQASDMPPADGATFVLALKARLRRSDPHRVALKGSIPVLFGPGGRLFSEETAFSRLRVQRVFEEVVVGSTDAPSGALAQAMGRLLYMVHLAVLLWWLLDKSAKQRATGVLVSLTQQILPSATVALRLPPVRRFVLSMDGLVREALYP